MDADLRGGLPHPGRVTIAAADRVLLATKLHPPAGRDLVPRPALVARLRALVLRSFLAPRWSVGRGGHAGDEWFVDLGATGPPDLTIRPS
jgi:hypothetical protein